LIVYSLSLHDALPIYHLDNQLSDLEPDDRKKQRQITVKPLVEAFFAWVKEIQSSNRLPKGKTLEGINYCINQEEALKVFLNDGEDRKSTRLNSSHVST